jgi:hypothetical protein
MLDQKTFYEIYYLSCKEFMQQYEQQKLDNLTNNLNYLNKVLAIQIENDGCENEELPYDGNIEEISNKIKKIQHKISEHPFTEPNNSTAFLETQITACLEKAYFRYSMNIVLTQENIRNVQIQFHLHGQDNIFSNWNNLDEGFFEYYADHPQSYDTLEQIGQQYFKQKGVTLFQREKTHQYR